MSLETMVASQGISQIQTNQTIQEIQLLQKELRLLRLSIEEPFVFLKSTNDNLSSNVADGVLILKGTEVRPNHRAVIQDFNVNFTTAAGTVRLVVLDRNENIVTDVLRDISSSTNGTGSTVIEEGEALAIVGQTAGAGTFSVYCTGKTQQVNNFG